RLTMSADGKRLAGYMLEGLENVVKVWDVSGQPQVLTTLHTGGVNALTLTPDGKRILWAGQDGVIRVCDSETGQQLFNLKGNVGVSSLSASPDGRHYYSCGYSGGADFTVKEWDARKGQEIVPFKGHSVAYPPNSVAVSADGKRIVSSSFEKTFKFWNGDTG